MTNELEQQILDMGCDHVYPNGVSKYMPLTWDISAYEVTVYNDGRVSIESTERQLILDGETFLYFGVQDGINIYELNAPEIPFKKNGQSRVEELIETFVPLAQFNEIRSGLKQIVESDEFIQYTAETEEAETEVDLEAEVESLERKLTQQKRMLKQKRKQN